MTPKWAIVLLYRHLVEDDVVVQVMYFLEEEDLVWKEYWDHLRPRWACQRLMDWPREPNI